MFGRRRYTVSREAVAQREAETPGREQQRREAAAKANLELDELDEQVRSGSAITASASGIVARMMTGTATLSEVQDFLAIDYSAEPYADVRSLTTQCMVMGLDASTGKLSLGPRLFLDGLRAGMSAQDALAYAMALPDAVALWSQDPEFRHELARVRVGQ